MYLSCCYTQADRKTALAQNGLTAQLSKPADKGSSYADLDFSDVSITSVICYGVCNANKLFAKI